MEENDFQVFSFNNMEWYYRGEGNANLVISFPEIRKILRLQKSEPVKQTFLQYIKSLFEQFNPLPDSTKNEIIIRNLKFYRRVIVPLIGPYASPAQAVFLISPEMKLLKKTLLNYRSAHRLHKNCQLSQGVLYPDYTFLPKQIDNSAPVFCIEIKPKQGWIPIPDRNLPSCIYCLNQYLKLKKGTIKKLSKYCPLDLFSCDEKRMIKALEALIVTPQNNLRIFENGQIIYEDGKSLEDLYENLRNWMNMTEKDSIKLIKLKFYNVIIKALLTNFNAKNAQIEIIEHLKSDEITVEKVTDSNTECSNLPHCDFLPEKNIADEGSVLDNIYKIQLLNQCGIKNIHPLFKKIFVDSGLNISQVSYNYVDDLINCCDSCCEEIKIINDGQNENNDISFADKQEMLMIQRYLLFATVRDCSIMIALQNVNDKDQVTQSENILKCDDSIYLVNVAVTDLDPKPVSCIEKHWKQKIQAVQACVNYFDS